jgi:hypothetical protein
MVFSARFRGLDCALHTALSTTTMRVPISRGVKDMVKKGRVERRVESYVLKRGVVCKHQPALNGFLGDQPS